MESIPTLRALLAALLLLFLASPSPAVAEEPSEDLSRPEGNGEPYYFYHGLDYGSESLIHPLRLMINGGYGIMQLDNRSNEVWEVDYATGAENVWNNITDPGWAVSENGWGEFFLREIIPISFKKGNAQYWPNYTQHLIGGGMSYRAISEWFRYHGFPKPKLFAGTSITVYHFLNEVVENDDRVGPNPDPVADLLIFDPLSIVLFSSDRVARFFSQTLHMADWSYQPAYNPVLETLENNGQNFAMKLDLPWWERWSLFYHYGTHAEMGLTRHLSGGRAISAGVGMKAGDLVELDSSLNTVDLGLSAGVFYDRNNSLLASVLVAATKDYKLRVNLYPGFIPLGVASPGTFLVMNQDNQFTAGITLDFLPHLPFGLAGDF